MGVARQQQVRAVLREVVQDPLVRGMDDRNPKVRVLVLVTGAAGQPA
ncbi:hypothetical protein AHiyo4_42730 [Arthrobacter sp. Hiyo4]|nr:hypothetical protein AHiyo4_42730 [Arthrobacter sp. Hiyo4]